MERNVEDLRRCQELTAAEPLVARIDTGLVGGTTDLAAGLILAGKFRELAAVVVVTDGQSDDNDAALSQTIGNPF